MLKIPKSHDAVADVPQSAVMHVLKIEGYLELTVHIKLLIMLISFYLLLI